MLLHRAFVDLAAGRFSYLDAGSGEDLVLLHALGRSATDWAKVIERLSDGWRCVAIDLRGHGQSVWPGRYSFEVMADDIDHFADALGLKHFNLVGHSMGANVAWKLAARRPKRIGRLIIEDTVPPRTPNSYPIESSEPPEAVDYDWEARRQIYSDLSGPSWWTDLETVTCPTLIVAGRRDDDIDSTVDLVPNAELALIEIGHWIHQQRPDDFTALVAGFLGDRTVTAE